MKQLNERFDDEDYAFLKKVKGSRTWRKFLLEMARNEDIK